MIRLHQVGNREKKKEGEEDGDRKTETGRRRQRKFKRGDRRETERRQRGKQIKH